MSLYRCEICGSPNVQRVENGKEFSYKKALVGTVVFGTVGAVAGINGKSSVHYVCPDCGLTRSSAMNDTERIVIDSISELPDNALPSFQKYLDRYPYIIKERQEKHSFGNEAMKPEILLPMNGEYTLSEVRQAIEDFNHAFGKAPRLCCIDPPCWRDFPIQNIEVYKKGFQALGIIANGLYAYPMLIMEEGAYSRYNLKDAFIAYILLNYGPLNCKQIYDVARDNPFLSRTMDALLDKKRYEQAIKPRHFEVRIPNGPQTYLPDKTEAYIDTFFTITDHVSITGSVERFTLFVVSPGYEADLWAGDYRLYKLFDFETPFVFGYKLCNESLYVSTVDVIELTRDKTKEINTEILGLLDQKKEIQYKASSFYSEISSIREKNKELEAEITALNDEAKKLRGKMFGKKKNERIANEKEAEADAKHREIEENNGKIDKLKKLDEAENENKKKKLESIEKDINSKIQLRSDLFKSIDRWICIAGPDCTVVPQMEDPTLTEERQKRQNENFAKRLDLIIKRHKEEITSEEFEKGIKEMQG